jgi:hypothetical protein
MGKPNMLLRQWLLTLLLGSAFYAAYHGIVHFSDWCYLGVSTFFAAGSSYLVIPLNGWLLHYLHRPENTWPPAARGAALLSGTAVLFGLANLLVLPLLSWPGPGSTGPWGVAALLSTLFVNKNLLNPPQP